MKKTILLTVISLVFLIGSQIKAQLPTVATDVSPLLVMEKIPSATLINA